MTFRESPIRAHPVNSYCSKRCETSVDWAYHLEKLHFHSCSAEAKSASRTKDSFPRTRKILELLFITVFRKRIKVICQDCTNITRVEETSMTQNHMIYLSGQSASWWGSPKTRVHFSFFLF